MHVERGGNAGAPCRFPDLLILGAAARRNRVGARRFELKERLSEEKMHKGRSQADDTDRPSEDDLARERLGGPKGSPELKPAPMTRQRRIKTPESDTEPGHTA
jgi:hypothetical protein